MKYQNKWILSHLGLTRKTLCNYEEMGLIDKKATQNPTNRYREYTEEDLEKLWVIWFLNQVGFQLSEVKSLLDNPDTEVLSKLKEKIEVLEFEKKLTEGKIHALQYMSATGHLPMPKRIGEARFEDLLAGVQSGLYDNDEIKTVVELQRSGINEPEGKAVKLIDIYEHLSSDESIQGIFDTLHLINTCTDTILLKKKQYSPEHEATQQAVTLAYELFCNLLFRNNQNEMTRDFFARYVLPLYSEFDFGAINQEKYGAENCKYIYEAISYFASQG